MLSKYTMALVPLAALAFVVLDRRLGRTLLSPWPWIGVLLACVVFAPVVVWNMQHDWASFAFQGSRRLDPEAKRFGLHLFVLFLFLVVTPWGIAGFVRGARRAAMGATAIAEGRRASPAVSLRGRALHFAVVFTVVPLLPLAVTSLWTETKLHWTGPIWLAALPVIATTMTIAADARASRFDRALAASWPHLVHVLLAVYAVGLFYYPVYGLAGIRAHHRYIETGWRDLRAQVQTIEDEVTARTGRRPAVVGLDKHNMADQMAFYDPRGDGPRDTASRNIVMDADALMYGFWFAPQDFTGRHLIVVACDRGAVEDPALARQAERVGEVRTLAVRKGGVHTRDCYARVLYGFMPEARRGRQVRP
jgi:dolichol-phosphate mannosyltransferase